MTEAEEAAGIGDALDDNPADEGTNIIDDLGPMPNT